jgi:hypothetical protein
VDGAHEPRTQQTESEVEVNFITSHWVAILIVAAVIILRDRIILAIVVLICPTSILKSAFEKAVNRPGGIK